MATKLLTRLEDLEAFRRHSDEELANINKNISSINTTLNNHIVHLQQAVRLLEIKSWCGLASDIAILLTTLLTLILTLRH